MQRATNPPRCGCIRRMLRSFQILIPWRFFNKSNRPPNLPVPVVAARRRIQRNPRPHRNKPRNVGPEMLDIFERIYGDFQALQDLRARVIECKEQIEINQGNKDAIEHNLAQAIGDPRVNHEDVAMTAEEEIPVLENEIATQNTELTTMEGEASELETSEGSHWKNVEKIAALYFNQCLASDFEPEWSLSECDCRELRHLLNRPQLIARSKALADQIMSRLIKARNARREARKADRAANPATTGRTMQNGQERQHQSPSADEAQIESEYKEERKLLERRKTLYRSERDRFCRGNIRQLLRTAGRIEIESTHHDEDPADDETVPQDEATPEDQTPMDEQTPMDDPTPLDQEEDMNQQDGSETAESPGSQPSSTSVDGLQKRYLETATALETLQQAHENERTRLRRFEVDHLLTFTDSTHEKYEELIARELADREGEMRQVERDLASLRRRLARDGHEIPVASDRIREGRIDKSARSKSSSISGSSAGRKSPRRKRPQSKDEDASQSPAKSASPGRSLSASPFPEREEYRREHREEYRKHQMKLRSERGAP